MESRAEIAADVKVIGYIENGLNCENRLILKRLARLPMFEIGVNGRRCD
jgi:hypothetical protein